MNFDVFNDKDIDGRWFRFDHQQMGGSCTMASTKIAKEFFHNQRMGEEALRGLANLFEADLANTGVSSLSRKVARKHNWEWTGADQFLTLQVLKAQPLPIPSARLMIGRTVAPVNVTVGWSVRVLMISTLP